MSYKELKSYEQATIIYDFTAEFCNRYIDRKSRTKDQMEQAARSGKQNIVEGSANRTSEKSELKLLGVARASFEELLEDYGDFLRQRGFPSYDDCSALRVRGLHQWGKDDPEARAVRNMSYLSDRTYKTYASYMENPETAANAAICLIHQANFLLDRQIKAAREQFVSKGGFTEQLSEARQ